MTQPAFSRLMSRFEKEMGVRLFERTTRHVTLTPEGVICLKRIDEILEAYDRMRTELEEAQSAVVTELHVGYNPCPARRSSLFRRFDSFKRPIRMSA